MEDAGSNSSKNDDHAQPDPGAEVNLFRTVLAARGDAFVEAVEEIFEKPCEECALAIPLQGLTCVHPLVLYLPFDRVTRPSGLLTVAACNLILMIDDLGLRLKRVLELSVSPVGELRAQIRVANESRDWFSDRQSRHRHELRSALAFAWLRLVLDYYLAEEDPGVASWEELIEGAVHWAWLCGSTISNPIVVWPSLTVDINVDGPTPGWDDVA